MHSSIQAVEAEVFGAFSAKLGISNIRDYEEKSLRKHQEQLQRHNTVAKQCAALVAQLEYEKKRDFEGVLARLNQQIREAEQENEALNKLEQSLLREELKVRALLKEANEKVAGLRTQKDELHQNLKATQVRRTEVLRDKESVSKKLAGEEILIERGRTQLHDILQKARVDEVALPTVQGGGSAEASEEPAESAGESASASAHRSRDRDDLTWEGTQSQSQRKRTVGRQSAGTVFVNFVLVQIRSFRCCARLSLSQRICLYFYILCMLSYICTHI